MRRNLDVWSQPRRFCKGLDLHLLMGEEEPHARLYASLRSVQVPEVAAVVAKQEPKLHTEKRTGKAERLLARDH